VKDPRWFETITHKIQEGYGWIFGIAGDYGAECFLINKETIPEVGWFDERFKGGGYEDSDMMERIKRTNIKYCHLQKWATDSGYVLYDNSKKTSPWNGNNNFYHFCKKWGYEHLPVPSNQKQMIEEIDWHPLESKAYRHCFKPQKKLLTDSIRLATDPFRQPPDTSFSCELECGHVFYLPKTAVTFHNNQPHLSKKIENKITCKLCKEEYE
tara:strand:- start:399 stop:1031 length:633 start_codon:yes stop_codon:yes gene_type:complete